MTNQELQNGPDLNSPPRGYFVVIAPTATGATFDLLAAIRFAFRSWGLLLGAALAGGCLAIAASYLMKPVFEAKVIAAPVSQDQGAGVLSALNSQFGGLAQLAGLDIGGATGGGRVEAFATLSSDSFVRDFIQRENLLPVLFEDRWNKDKGAWKHDDRAPTLDEGVRFFTESVRFISEDRKTSLVSIRIHWTSPELAARWANLMVAMANERLRSEAMANAERSIEYLNREVSNTNVVELREVLYRLIESQLSTKTLATVQEQYAFRIIDPAVPPDPQYRIRPRRLLLGVAGAFGAGLVTLLVRVWRNRQLFIADRPEPAY